MRCMLVVYTGYTSMVVAAFQHHRPGMLIEVVHSKMKPWMARCFVRPAIIVLSTLLDFASQNVVFGLERILTAALAESPQSQNMVRT
jgi:hypothetical protein